MAVMSWTAVRRHLFLFICGLFNDAVTTLVCIALNGRIINENELVRNEVDVA
jgi:uncharacterized membrane protein